MLRLRTSLICLFVSISVFGQEYNSPLGKGKKNNNLCLRIELGWNEYWFTSLGASYVHSNINSHSPFVFVVYASADASLAPYRSPITFYAYKAGIELGNMIFAYGAELRNNTDFAGKNNLVFMPKIGISLFGHAGLFYGYNIFSDANNTFGIGHSQLSLSISINRKLFKETLVPSH